ncbi:MAG: 3-isopropylmalate dehydratase small subunit [Streptosporangiaceae bacterium]
MRPLTSHTGRAVALRRSNVDTDQIVPSEFCKRVTKTGYADALFARWRLEPDFVLNRAASVGATVLLAGPDFGIGSSREHAVWALRDGGFSVVASARFGDIFARNALKNGLLTTVLPEEVVNGLMDVVDADPGLEITVDLEEKQVRAPSPAGGLRCWPFEIDGRARWLILNGYDDIAVTLQHDGDIARYEQARDYWLPVIRRGAAGHGPAARTCR